jgi:hypothetical protein
MKLSVCLLRAIVMANNINSLVFVMYTVLVLCEVCAVMSSAITRRLLSLRARGFYQIIPREIYVDKMALGHFLGAFANLQKASISFVKSVRLSEWHSSAPTGRIFMKFRI